MARPPRNPQGRPPAFRDPVTVEITLERRHLAAIDADCRGWPRGLVVGALVDALADPGLPHPSARAAPAPEPDETSLPPAFDPDVDLALILARIAATPDLPLVAHDETPPRGRAQIWMDDHGDLRWVAECNQQHGDYRALFARARDDLSALIREIDALLAHNAQLTEDLRGAKVALRNAQARGEHFAEREAAFIAALQQAGGVADGGQYRSDCASAVHRIAEERDAAATRAGELERALRALAAATRTWDGRLSPACDGQDRDAVRAAGREADRVLARRGSSGQR